LISLRWLRLVAFIEGVSFLVLLFVAMPLKYFAGMPLAVRMAGSIHGALFLAFVLVLIWASVARRWPFHRSVLAFVSSIVPFGTFAFDVSLRREIAAAAQLRNVELRLDPGTACVAEAGVRRVGVTSPTSPS
jgi:integral membrane protein